MNKNLLKGIRICLAVFCIIAISFLFVDFTGMAAGLFGWIAKIQFLPALLALNIGVVAILLALTLLLGRIYCSVICPLGVMQDIVAWFGKKFKRNRYSYSRPLNVWRYSVIIVFAIALFLGLNFFVALLAPYSSYGRIVSSFLKPVWVWGNNMLASVAESNDSYAFYNVEYGFVGISVVVVAAVTFIVLAVLAWRNGRTYCNSVCPVGTLLGFFSRFSLFRPVIDKSKCVNCNLCSRNCKSSCIDIERHEIDYSRCVACFDCISKCNKGAVSYTFRRNSSEHVKVNDNDDSRRKFLTVTSLFALTAARLSAEKTVDGGLAVIEDKKIPKRKTRIVPPGAQSLRNLNTHCTACQLCVSNCPNGVLRPSSDLETFMQPESSYEKGYCRPECNKCSEVCPAGAIRFTDIAEKSSIQIGHAVWVKENCVPLTDGVECGNCARHCPTGAISMVVSEKGVKIPVVNTERCIGCGACENLCPARPFSAIYVEGHENHRHI